MVMAWDKVETSAMTQLIEKSTEFNLFIYIASVDYIKAFAIVNMDVLCQILKLKGFL
jgi:hypothetical protein